jgi:hypothetical protein
MKEVNAKWEQILKMLETQFDKKMDMNAILLVIGIREYGKVKENFTKEEKVRLMHIAVCRLFSPNGFYKLKGHNYQGWPQWEKIEDLPFGDVFEQESLLRQHIVSYFEDEEILN